MALVDYKAKYGNLLEDATTEVDLSKTDTGTLIAMVAGKPKTILPAYTIGKLLQTVQAGDPALKDLTGIFKDANNPVLAYKAEANAAAELGKIAKDNIIELEVLNDKNGIARLFVVNKTK